MLKEGKEDLDLTLAKVGQLLEAKKSVIDKELERQTQEALVKVGLYLCSVTRFCVIN